MHAHSILILLFFILFYFSSFAVAQAPAHVPILEFCAGSNFVCVSFETYSFKCFGMSSSWGIGSTAIGTSIDQLGDNLPYVFIGKDRYTEGLTCGGTHVCMIDYFLTGPICLGNNEFGQCGISSAVAQPGKKVPFANVGLQAIYAVHAGYQHTCVQGYDVNKVVIKCFGRNNFGQLGLGNTNDVGKDPTTMGSKLPAVKIGNSDYSVTLFTGSMSSHTCAVMYSFNDDYVRAKCWGLGLSGQLGYGDTNNKGDNANEMGDKLPFIDFGDQSDVRKMVLGALYTCSLFEDDRLKCFGSGAFGQIGSGSTDPIKSTGTSMPLVLLDDNLLPLVDVVAGESHTCVFYNDTSAVKCVGRNNLGQLGQSDSSNRGDTLPTTIPNIPFVDVGAGSLEIMMIRAGGNFTCVIFSESSVKCFGDNQSGQLATGTVATAIGDVSGEMGENLKYAFLFSPTANPSNAPTFSPTKAPTAICSSALDKKSCKKDFRCNWQKVGSTQACVAFKCSNLKLFEQCTADLRCTWLSAKSKCLVFDCTSFYTKNLCAIEPRCQWKRNQCLAKKTSG